MQMQFKSKENAIQIKCGITINVGVSEKIQEKVMSTKNVNLVLGKLLKI